MKISQLNVSNSFSGRMLNIRPVEVSYSPVSSDFDEHDYSVYSIMNDAHKKRLFNDKNEEYSRGYTNDEAIKNSKFFFYNSSIHYNKWGDWDKVYFLDPNEGESDNTRRACLIVRDNEPSYPDVHKEVSKNYFGNAKEDYIKHWQTVKEYFKRVENADLKTLKEIPSSDKNKILYYVARIKHAQKQQEITSNCIDIYNKSKKLREEKMKLEDELASYNSAYTHEPLSEYRIERVKKSIDYIKGLLISYFDELKDYYQQENIIVKKQIK